MKLTIEEEKERNCLIEYQKSRSRFMSDQEQVRLTFLSKKQFHNCCSNIHCTGHEGLDIETICPKCKSPLHKLI